MFINACVHADFLSILVILVIDLGNMKLLLVNLATRVFTLFYLSLAFNISFSYSEAGSLPLYCKSFTKTFKCNETWFNLLPTIFASCGRMTMSSIKNESLQNDHDGSDEDANGDNAADGDDVDRRR